MILRGMSGALLLSHAIEIWNLLKKKIIYLELPNEKVEEN